MKPFVVTLLSLEDATHGRIDYHLPPVRSGVIEIHNIFLQKKILQKRSTAEREVPSCLVHLGAWNDMRFDLY